MKHIYPLTDEVLERFCLEILPKIHHRIEWLTVESLSMERIFLVCVYPILLQLDFASIHREALTRIFG